MNTPRPASIPSVPIPEYQGTRYGHSVPQHLRGARATPEGRWPRRALLRRWRRERLLAHARQRRLHLRGARRLLSAGPMRHFDVLHIYKEPWSSPAFNCNTV